MRDPYLQEWLLAPDGIATRLRQLRGERTGKDFAEAAGMRPAKLSKLELAQQTPTEGDIRQVVAAAGAPTSIADDLAAKLQQMPNVRTEGERKLRFGQVAAQRRLNERLSGARRVRVFESVFMPRLLQERSYAEVMLTELGRATAGADEARQAAAVLTDSAQFLFDPRREFEIVIAEPVLRWQTVEPAVLRAQLERILSAMKAPTVTVKVLPLDTPLAVHPTGSFALYDDAGYLDSLNEGAELSGASLKRHAAMMDDLSRASAGTAKTRAIIRASLERLP